MERKKTVTAMNEQQPISRYIGEKKKQFKESLKVSVNNKIITCLGC